MKAIYFSTAILFAISIPRESLIGQESAASDVLQGFVKRTVGQTPVQIHYGSPRVVDRRIWGDVVPFAEDWIAGAGTSTTIQFDEQVQINGNNLAAGIYGLYVHPLSRTDWQIVFSRDTAVAENGFDQSSDVLRISVTPHLAQHRDRLKLGLEEVRYQEPFKASLYLHWGDLKARLSLRMTGRLPSSNRVPKIPAAANEPWDVVRDSVTSLAAEQIERAVEHFAEDFETDFGDGGSTAAYVQLMNNLKRGGLLEEMEISFDELVVDVGQTTAVFKNVRLSAPFGESRLNYSLERRDEGWQVVSILKP